MKLQAKARPVQITKLRLGGRDIMTKEELLQNFCVSEIIDLGSKFTQWLDRHNEVKAYADRVSSIFNGKKNKEKQASALLALFFPEHEGQSLINVFYDWQEKGKDDKVLFSLLNSISPNAQLAIDLMNNDKLEKNRICLAEWLKSCSSKIFITSEFCFAYGVFLESIDEDKSKKWLYRAADMGHEEANELINKGKVLYVKIRDWKIAMIRVSDKNGSFYIAEHPFRNALFNDLGFERNQYKEFEDKGFRKRGVCDECLKKLNRETEYYWDYPTSKQWDKAKELNKIEIEECSTEDGEWCREITGIYKYRIAGSESHSFSLEEECRYFRPVIEISKNPTLNE